jgi:hypothetical protein
MLRNPAGTVAGGWSWDVVAERAGSYEIWAAVEPEQPDPDRSNNTFTLTFEVRTATGGGGSTATVVASAVKLAPAAPKAGSRVTASVSVTAGGTPVVPTGVACRASISRATIRGTPNVARGAASCVFRTPRSAKGKLLRGAVAFSARGRQFAKRFAVRLR